MKTLILLLALTSCGTPYTVRYADPDSGLIAGYSSKRGFDIQYRPLADK